MGTSVVDAFLRGNRGAWIGLLVALALTAAITFFQRASRTSPARVLLLSALVSVLSVVGILVAMALAVPRIVWRRVAPPAYAVATGDVWRTLRAPSASVLDHGRPDIGLPGVDAAGHVRLYGLFSGAPLEDYPEAPSLPPVSGRARICRFDVEECRAWPPTWPEPGAPPAGSDFVWTRDLAAGVLAYDVESTLLLHHVEGLRPVGGPVAMAGTSAPIAPSPRGRTTAGAWALEQTGKLTNEPSRDGPTALFVVRRITDQRLDAVRVVATPSGDTFAYSVERATVSLTAAPSALTWFARPLLLVLVVWFPLVTLLLQAAPALWASRRRKQMAAGAPVSEMPATPAEAAAHARLTMARQLHPLAVLAIGLAVAAPALVGVVGLVAAK